jgi:hypothetical protein
LSFCPLLPVIVKEKKFLILVKKARETSFRIIAIGVKIMAIWRDRPDSTLNIAKTIGDL